MPETVGRRCHSANLLGEQIVNPQPIKQSSGSPKICSSLCFSSLVPGGTHGTWPTLSFSSCPRVRSRLDCANGPPGMTAKMKKPMQGNVPRLYMCSLATPGGSNARAKHLPSIIFFTIWKSGTVSLFSLGAHGNFCL